MIQQVKCKINFFHRQYNCLTLLLCCIFFLFSTNFSKAEEVPSNDKVESNDSRVGVYIVDGTSVANIDHFKGAKEVKYIEAKKNPSKKEKRQKKSTSEIKSSVSVDETKPPKTEEKIIVTSVSPVKKENSLISSSRQTIAAITVLIKIINKYKNSDKQNFSLKEIPEFKKQSLFGNHNDLFVINTYSQQVSGIRPPPFLV